MTDISMTAEAEWVDIVLPGGQETDIRLNVLGPWSPAVEREFSRYRAMEKPEDLGEREIHAMEHQRLVMVAAVIGVEGMEFNGEEVTADNFAEMSPKFGHWLARQVFQNITGRVRSFLGSETSSETGSSG